MNTELIPFAFDGRQVRTVVINGEPWFGVSDLCTVLEIQNPRDVVAKNLRKDDVARIYTLAADGKQRKIAFTNEPGVFRLILRSYKPDAERFQDWICREVLPAIRKTGRFQVDLRGWLSSGPKPWTKTFPDRYYAEILRLHGKASERLKEQEPWLAQLTENLIYRRLTTGVVETLRKVNPIPPGRRWRTRKHHQHVSAGEAEKQFNRLLGECVGALSAAKTWDEFLAVWDAMHPLVSPLPAGIEATLSDAQLWLFNFAKH